MAAGARVHEDIVEHEIALDNLEQRHIGQRAGPQRANLLLQSQHGRRSFGGGADYFGEAHAEGEEFAQAGGHVEHRAADAHLVDVGGDDVRPVALRHQGFGGLEGEGAGAMADIQHQAGIPGAFDRLAQVA